MPSPLGRRREHRLQRLLEIEGGIQLVFGLADRALRPVSATAAHDLLAKLASGDVSALRPIDRFLFQAAVWAGRPAPALVMSLVRGRVRYETRPLVFSEDPRRLGHALRDIRKAGGRTNVNLLGEAILGEQPAGA